MAAKVKLLMRELKTLKSDLSFANERCAQFEVENKILSRTRDKRVDPEDDDLVYNYNSIPIIFILSYIIQCIYLFDLTDLSAT